MLRELLVLFFFLDVRNGTVDCNQSYLHWNKEKFSFLNHEFVHSDVCNFLIRSLAELSVFLLLRCLAFLFMRILNKIIHRHIDRHQKSL